MTVQGQDSGPGHFRLLRYFSLGSAAAFVIATGLLAVLWNRDSVQRAVDIAERQNVHLAGVVMTALRQDRQSASLESMLDTLRRGRAAGRVDEYLRALVSESPVLKVKIFDAAGTALYSPVKSEIGQAESTLGTIARVLRTGIPASSHARHREISGFSGLLRDREILETYIPIAGSTGEFVGAFEIYADITSEMMSVRQSTWRVVLTVLIAFGSLYAVLFLIVRRADRDIRRHFNDVQERDNRILGETAQIEREMAGRLRAEEELGDYTLLLQRTLETIEHGICVYDRELRLVAWNQKYIEMTGHDPDRVQRGRSAYDLILDLAKRGQFGEEDAVAVTKAREAYYFSGRRHTVEERVREDGSTVLIERTPMPDGGYVSCFTDITERRRVEEDLMAAKESAELASRVKTEFLANVSHELRTPLNSIIGFSQILQGDVASEKRREYAHDIHWSGTHLLEVINDILDVSRIEAGELALYPEPLDVQLLLAECQRMFHERLAGADLALSIRVEDEIPTITADPLRLRQALFNLLSNAVKFTQSGGRIDVSVRHPVPDQVEISVKDTGIGIAAADIERVLLPFSQARSVHERPHEGSGLGLYLVKSIVELHNGSLELESEPEVGTTVTIRLPVDASTQRNEPS